MDSNNPRVLIVKSDGLHYSLKPAIPENFMKMGMPVAWDLIVPYIKYAKELQNQNIDNPVTVKFLEKNIDCLMQHPDFSCVLGKILDYGYPSKDLWRSILVNQNLKNEAKLKLVKSFVGKVDVTEPFDDGYFPLHYAVNLLQGNAENVEIVKSLLDAGADVNVPSSHKDFPIFGANSYEMLNLLIERGANINVKNGFGRTALYVIRDLKAIKLLLDSGVFLNVKDNDDRTPLDECVLGCRSVEKAKILIQYGARLDSRNKDGKTLLQCLEDMTSSFFPDRDKLIDLLKSEQEKLLK